MAILSNPIILYTILGCSICTAIGLSFLLIKFSIRDQTKALLQERLDFIKRSCEPSIGHPEILLKKEALVPFESENKVTEYFSTLFGIELNPKLLTVLLGFLAVFIPVPFVFLWFYGTYLGLIFVIFFFSIIIGVFWILKFRRDRFLKACEAQLPEMLDFIVRALKAGHAFPISISLVGEELKAPLGPEIHRVFKQQELGLTLSSALLNLSKRIPIMDLKYFVTAYLVNKEIGGNLADVLDNISKIIRERFKLKRHVQALTAEGRISAWILSLMPIVTAGAIFTIRPEYIHLLITEPLGQKLIFAALVLWLIGIIVIKRIVHIDY